MKISSFQVGAAFSVLQPMDCWTITSVYGLISKVKGDIITSDACSEKYKFTVITSINDQLL